MRAGAPSLARAAKSDEKAARREGETGTGPAAAASSGSDASGAAAAGD